MKVRSYVLNSGLDLIKREAKERSFSELDLYTFSKRAKEIGYDADILVKVSSYFLLEIHSST